MSEAKKNGSAIQVAMPEGFTEIKLDRLQYKPETCKSSPVVGWLLALITLPGAKGNDPWEAFVVKTTVATKGANRDNEVVDVPAGDEILVPATAKLIQAFEAASKHPDKVFQVFIQPLEKTVLAGGKTMWEYKFGKGNESRPRTGEFAFVSGAAPVTNQMSEGVVASA